MNVLVLGGNGYLGSKIINELLTNYNVWCTIREGEQLNLLKHTGNVNIISDSIDCIKETINEIKFDLLINTVCCYERDNCSYSSVIDANLLFPLQIIPFAIEHGIKKIITIDTSLPENLNLYSLTKKSIAKIGNYYCKKFQSISFLNIVLENFYGEDEPKNRFIHLTIEKMKNDLEVNLTKGTQKRDFIYIDDVLCAFRILINNFDVGYHDVSIGTEEGPTIREIVEYLKTLTNSKSKLNFGVIESRKNEPNCIANLDYLRKYGYRIQFPYKLGLKKII